MTHPLRPCLLPRPLPRQVEMCMLSHPHIWKTCPYVHPGEPIKRRPHSTHHPDLCPDVKKGRMCSYGPDRCHWAHNTFESWLHPERFRTIMCRDGAKCNRAICFFAHSQAQVGAQHWLCGWWPYSNQHGPHAGVVELSGGVRCCHSMLPSPP